MKEREKTGRRLEEGRPETGDVRLPARRVRTGGTDAIGQESRKTVEMHESISRFDKAYRDGSAANASLPNAIMPECEIRQVISLSGWVNTLSGRVNTLSDRVNPQSGSRENQSGWHATLSGRVAGLSGFEKNATGRVNILSDRLQPQSGSQYFQSGRVNPQPGSRYFQLGSENFQPGRIANQPGSENFQPGNQNTLSGKGFNLLMINDYLLFPENKEHRIRNTESGNLKTPQRGEMLIAPGKEERRNPGLSAPHKSAPLFNAPALATGNKKHRIRNTESGNLEKPHRDLNLLMINDYLFDEHNACISNHGAGELGYSLPKALPWAELYCLPIFRDELFRALNQTVESALKGRYISVPEEMSGQASGNSLHKQGDGFYSALKGRLISARGNALGRRTPTTPGPQFSAPALATENKEHRIRNTESGSLIQPHRARLNDEVGQGDIMVARGNALGRRTPTTPAPLFNAPALATGKMWLKPTEINRNIEVFNIPMSFTFCPLGRSRRTRDSQQGAGSQGLPAALVIYQQLV